MWKKCQSARLRKMRGVICLVSHGVAKAFVFRTTECYNSSKNKNISSRASSKNQPPNIVRQTQKRSNPLTKKEK